MKRIRKPINRLTARWCISVCVNKYESYGMIHYHHYTRRRPLKFNLITLPFPINQPSLLQINFFKFLLDLCSYSGGVPAIQLFKSKPLKFKAVLTLIRKSWKKIQNAGPSPSAFYGKKSSAALHHFVYIPMLWNFYPIALGDGPKKCHIFLFSTAYFLS